MKRENIERRREKWSEAERWSVRESRQRDRGWRYRHGMEEVKEMEGRIEDCKVKEG